MGIATGLSAARMLEIENTTIVGGFIGLDGHLLLQARDGDTVDAGMVRGAPGRDAMYSVVSSVDATPIYKRLFNIVGGGPSDGGHIQFLISGLGSIGTARRGTVLVHASQRGANGINLRAWAWGIEDLLSPLTLYTRQMSETTFEIWAFIGSWSRDVNVQVLSNYHTEITMDNTVTAAPSGLVVQTVTNYAPDATQTIKGLLEIATNGEVQIGTDAVRAVTPAGLASVVGIGTGYRFVQRVVFTSSGTFSKASYPGLRAIRVLAIGGGGSGAGAGGASGGMNSYGTGGGSGAYAESFITDIVGLAASVSVTVGAGGNASAAGAIDGSDGSASSFGALVAAGGGGKGFTKPNSSLGGYVQGGTGGTATAGDIQQGGTPGGNGNGRDTLAQAGNGGSSIFGGGGQGPATGAGSGAINGYSGTAFGAGGSGATVNSGGTARPSGAGSSGVVIVEIYR